MKISIGAYLRAMLVVCVLASLGVAQQTGSLGGQIIDSQGDAIVGVTVVAKDKAGKETNTVSDSRGYYRVRRLAPGKYTISAQTAGFGLFETTDVLVEAGKTADLPVMLNVEGIQCISNNIIT